MPTPAAAAADAVAAAAGESASSQRSSARGRVPVSLCWACDLSAFRRTAAASGAPFTQLLEAIESDLDERARIMKFHFPQDRQRAMLGRMLNRAALMRLLGQRVIGELG
jgi:hypothetical protein